MFKFDWIKPSNQTDSASLQNKLNKVRTNNRGSQFLLTLPILRIMNFQLGVNKANVIKWSFSWPPPQSTVHVVYEWPLTRIYFFRLHDVPFPDILLAVIFVFNFLKLTITEINNNFLGFDKSIFWGIYILFLNTIPFTHFWVIITTMWELLANRIRKWDKNTL